ncbi:MAG: hypothetical protein V8S34_06395 [Lawsonibacter sp.]
MDSPFYTNEERDQLHCGRRGHDLSGEPYTEVQLGQGNPAGVKVDGRNVTALSPPRLPPPSP